jgi:hypothetical protein
MAHEPPFKRTRYQWTVTYVVKFKHKYAYNFPSHRIKLWKYDSQVLLADFCLPAFSYKQLSVNLVEAWRLPVFRAPPESANILPA